MVPWIQVYSNIISHDKTYALAEKLKIQKFSAVGIMVSLWCWAAVNAPDGDVSRYPQQALSDAVGWNKKADALYKALIDIKILEKIDNGNVVIRNWENYASLLIDMMENQKEKTKERVKKHREKNKRLFVTETVTSGVNTQCDIPLQTSECNVTETLCNAPTEPNLTISNIDDDDDVCMIRAHAHEDLYSVDNSVDNYIGVTNELKSRIQDVSSSLWKRFFNRMPTPEECVWVWLKTREGLSNGQYQVSNEKLELLEYACIEALRAGAMNMKYIDGIYANFAQRGIKSISDAAKYDFQRDVQRGAF